MNAPLTVNDRLERAASSADTGLRFIDRHEEALWLPWTEIAARACRAAGALQGAGVEPGDRVALIEPTGPAFFDGFFGILLAGAVPVPTYPPVRLGRLDEYHRRTGGMLADVRARLVLADRRVRRILGETVARARPALGCRILADLAPHPWRRVPVGPDDLALVQFSSGTTMEPKPVALTHQAVMTQAVLLNGFWPDDGEVRHSGLSWLPLYHDMGLIGCAMAALERPATLTLLPPELFVSRPALWLRAISRYRASVSPAPNFAYALAAAKIQDEELDGVDLSCWRVALNGAETVVPSTCRAFERRFSKFGFAAGAMTPVYGMSEAALAVTFSGIGRGPVVMRFEREALAREGRAVPGDDGIEIVSLGQPLPGFALQVVNERGDALPEGREGVVRIQGPTLMRGYLDRPALTARAFAGGWLDSGDRGFLWAGELYLTGRDKDMLLLRGRNHAPQEVEQAAESVPGARAGGAAAVSYLPEGGEGEVLVLFVESARGVASDVRRQLGKACGEAVIARTGLSPAQVIVLEPGTLPRTSSGKLRRQEALARHLAGELRPPEPVSWPRMLRAMARSRRAFTRSRAAE